MECRAIYRSKDFEAEECDDFYIIRSTADRDQQIQVFDLMDVAELLEALSAVVKDLLKPAQTEAP